MLNHRLHSWNFRKLQSYIEYKTKLNSLPVKYVNAKHTSAHAPYVVEDEGATWTSHVNIKVMVYGLYGDIPVSAYSGSVNLAEIGKKAPATGEVRVKSKGQSQSKHNP